MPCTTALGACLEHVTEPERVPRKEAKMNPKDEKRLGAVAILAPAAVVWPFSLELALVICAVATLRGLYVEAAY